MIESPWCPINNATLKNLIHEVIEEMPAKTNVVLAVIEQDGGTVKVGNADGRLRYDHVGVPKK